MTKTLKDFLDEASGILKVKNPDEQTFVDKHQVQRTNDRNGNDDDVFGGPKQKKIKAINRRKERKGYDPGDDAAVYEAVETERVKHPVGQRPKGIGWVLKSAGEQTGKDHSVWERKFKRVGNTNEELKGNQHKIDANKNGKVDAHDFKLLRKDKDADDIPFEGPYRQAGVRKDKYGNVIKNVARHLARKGMKANEEVEELDEDKVRVGTLAQRTQAYRDDKAKKAGAKLQTDPDTGTPDHFTAAMRRKRGLPEEADDDGWYTHSQMYGRVQSEKHPKAISSAEWKSGIRWHHGKNKRINIKEESKQVDEADYSAKAARAGKDIGKPGKQFSKIAAKAAAKYGSAERGRKVAGAVLANLRKEDRLVELLTNLSESTRNIMLETFTKLNEDNQYKFIAACETEDGIDHVLNFSIMNRGK